MSELDLATSVALGIALAAAVGFRVFLPLLVMSAAGYTGYLPLADSFAWLATPTALIMLGAAALAEVLAYYVPGFDNLLDALAAPAAVVAGIIASAAVMTDLPPLVRWTTAVIAGGGAAGLMHGAAAALRAGSTATTGGFGNFAVATGELAGALFVPLLALVAPVIALVLVIVVGVLAFHLLRRLSRRAPASKGSPAGAADG